jgi:hypothetical protein
VVTGARAPRLELRVHLLHRSSAGEGPSGSSAAALRTDHIAIHYGYLSLASAAWLETRPRDSAKRFEHPARGSQPQNAKHCGMLRGSSRSRTRPQARPARQAVTGRRRGPMDRALRGGTYLRNAVCDRSRLPRSPQRCQKSEKQCGPLAPVRLSPSPLRPRARRRNAQEHAGPSRRHTPLLSGIVL